MPTKPIKDGYITSGYGDRILNGKREFHPGIDISSHNPTLPDVVAAYDGIIRWIDNDHPVYDPKTNTGSFGRVVYVQRSDKLYCIYPHLDSIEPTLKIGQQIKEGQKIGVMGNTGLSWGSHLHFEIRPSMTPGNSICPQEIIDLYTKK